MDGASLPPSIARIDRTGTGLWSFSLRPSLVLVVVSLPPNPPSLGFLRTRPAGEAMAADGTVRGMRERLEGGRLEALCASKDEVLVVVCTTGGVRTFRARSDGVWVEEGSPATLPPSVPIPNEGVDAEQEPELLTRWQTLLAEQERRAASKVLGAARRKLQRRVAAIDDDARRAEESEGEAADARVLLPIAARAPRGAREIEAVDWSSGEPRTARRELDPSRGAREQLEEVFARARRMKSGEGIRNRRKAEAGSAIDTISRALSAIEHEPSAARVRAVTASALEALPAGIAPRGTKSRLESGALAARPQRHADDPIAKCAREYRSSDGASILVGRDAGSNDVLTTRVARPQDVWMHVRGRTGSHVVVRMAKGKSPPPQTLVDAATLAAYFSDARGEPCVEVSWCERRFVRKPKGAAAGAVTLSHEKTIVLRWEQSRLERLLATLR